MVYNLKLHYVYTKIKSSVNCSVTHYASRTTVCAHRTLDYTVQRQRIARCMALDRSGVKGSTISLGDRLGQFVL